jgi:hypothetical protein
MRKETLQAQPFDLELMSLQLLNFILSDTFNADRLKIIVGSELLGAAIALREFGEHMKGGFAGESDDWKETHRLAARRLFDTSSEVLPDLPKNIAHYVANDIQTVRTLAQYAAIPVNDDSLYALTLEGYHFQDERDLHERAAGLALLLMAAHYIEHHEHPRASTEYLRRSMVKEMRVDGKLDYERGYAQSLYNDLRYIAPAFVAEAMPATSEMIGSIM